jgi:hypothetical protein
MVVFMPRAMRVDRLLSKHGIGQDSAAGRQEFERQMENRAGGGQCRAETRLQTGLENHGT